MEAGTAALERRTRRQDRGAEGEEEEAEGGTNFLPVPPSSRAPPTTISWPCPCQVSGPTLKTRAWNMVNSSRTYTLNPEPSTLNPQPRTLNHEP